MRYLIGLSAVALAVACFAVALFIQPSQAQDCPAPLPDTVAAVEASGGELVDLIDVRSEHFDQLVVIVVGGSLVIGGVKDGCLVTPPIPLDTVKAVTPA